MPWKRLAAVSLVALFAIACKKDINNKEAVRTAIVQHLSNKEGLGLDMNKMDVQVSTVSFQTDQAQATVSIGAKGGGAGMEMNYSLERKGDAWQVKPRAAAEGNPHGGAMPTMPPPATGGGGMPPGHPPTGAGK